MGELDTRNALEGGVADVAGYLASKIVAEKGIIR